jgi:hypothetical protein
VTVDPGTWRERDRINIKAGLSPGERRRKASALAQVVSHQLTLMQAGLDGVLVNLPNVYASMRDWCAASGIDAGERYFTDPSGQSATQASQQKLQQGQQAQQMQQQLAMAQLKLEDQKQQLDKYKADKELEFKYWSESLGAEVEEAKIVGGATADLQLAELAGRQRAGADAGAAAVPAGGAG